MHEEGSASTERSFTCKTRPLQAGLQKSQMAEHQQSGANQINKIQACLAQGSSMTEGQPLCAGPHLLPAGAASLQGGPLSVHLAEHSQPAAGQGCSSGGPACAGHAQPDQAGSRCGHLRRSLPVGSQAAARQACFAAGLQHQISHRESRQAAHEWCVWRKLPHALLLASSTRVPKCILETRLSMSFHAE